MQIGQLANTMSHLQSARSNNLPSPTDADFETDANSQVPKQDRSILLLFLTWTLSEKKPESDEELLKMFQKVEINIPLLDAIK
ncbi:hypothetical protein CR513_36645, partial [Mucuna pruriens]